MIFARSQTTFVLRHALADSHRASRRTIVLERNCLVGTRGQFAFMRPCLIRVIRIPFYGSSFDKSILHGIRARNFLIVVIRLVGRVNVPFLIGQKLFDLISVALLESPELLLFATLETEVSDTIPKDIIAILTIEGLAVCIPRSNPEVKGLVLVSVVRNFFLDYKTLKRPVLDVRVVVVEVDLIIVVHRVSIIRECIAIGIRHLAIAIFCFDLIDLIGNARVERRILTIVSRMTTLIISINDNDTIRIRRVEKLGLAGRTNLSTVGCIELECDIFKFLVLIVCIYLEDFELDKRAFTLGSATHLLPRINSL